MDLREFKKKLTHYIDFCHISFTHTHKNKSVLKWPKLKTNVAI